MSRRQWTKPQLRQAAEMFAAGARWDDVGARFGVTGNAVRRTLIAHGMKPERERHRAPKREELILRAIAHRNRTGESWALTREAIGYPGTPAALRRRCMVVAERERLELRMGYPAVKRRRG